MHGSNIRIWSRMADGIPTDFWNPLPNFVLFPIEDLYIFSNAGLAIMDVLDDFAPDVSFSLTILRQNQLVANMVDRYTGPRDQPMIGSSTVFSHRKVMVMLHKQGQDLLNQFKDVLLLSQLRLRSPTIKSIA